LTLASVAFALGIYGLYRYRVARLVEVERIRTRIATDLHDDIGSNLSLIAMASEVANRRVPPPDSQIAEWLSLIANTSRATVDSMSDIVWAVNPSKDRVSDLTQRMRRVADDIFTTREIAFRFSAPDAHENQTLPAETRREVFMIFKEAVNNIARHSACARADVELNLGGGWLELKLSDDGRGFDVAGGSDGNGLTSMHRRAKNLGGSLEIVSRPTEGTTVILKAPMDGQFRRRR
jgi:signal transduction histidine kinase